MSGPLLFWIVGARLAPTQAHEHDADSLEITEHR